VRVEPLERAQRFTLLCLAAVLLVPKPVTSQTAESLLPGPKPADISWRLKGLVGEYAQEKIGATVLEREGSLIVHFFSPPDLALKQGEPWEDKFIVSPGGGEPEQTAVFERGGEGVGLTLFINGKIFTRRLISSEGMISFHIIPLRPVDVLRREALAATPPHEDGVFRKSDLVELAPLDASIHLDIRYATSNDFLGTPVYSQARAFLQRPAADALLRVQQKLKPLGYGLLIHDAYRPWYVTKIFWDATPPEGKIFVADPAQGSRHNRGCAVDLTLYDLASGKPIEMPGTYDEMSPRSFPDYPGGTSLQRWHRDLLRRAMESEGFTVYEAEWWHFDYKDWKEYPILNVPFEKLGVGSGAAVVH
jgi:D-alanyl-D-alanine dipeptidase